MDLEPELRALGERSLLRRLREVRLDAGARIESAGRILVNFSSNDYLGFAGDDRLRRAAREAIERYGVGTGGSRLLCGTLPPHTRLEERLAAFEGAPAALTFSSGYAAALGAVTTLVGRGDMIVLDKLCHACLIDAARLSGATIRVFPHNDLARLEHQLARARERLPKARVLVATESVFSMEGDRAPLDALVDLKERYGAALLVDEAHALGVVGGNGRGLAHALDVAPRVDVRMGTLSKALGVSGGYLCGATDLIALLVNRARSFIYSTAPPAALAAAAAAALDLLDSDEGEQRRVRLWERIAQLDALVPETLRPPRLPGSAPASAIFPVLIGDETRALEASAALERAGFYLPAIRHPTVARGRARLRATLSAAHAPEDVERLGRALSRLADPPPA